jgi:hypothetical protein
VLLALEQIIKDKSLGKWFDISLRSNNYSSIMEQIISAPAVTNSADFSYQLRQAPLPVLR